MINKYYYSITIDRVIDGDTLDAIFDLGFNLKYKVRVRLKDIDTPETYRATSAIELEYGTKMKEYLLSLLELYKGKITCLSANIDLYGRSEGTVFAETAPNTRINLNEECAKYMLANKLSKQDVKDAVALKSATKI